MNRFTLWLLSADTFSSERRSMVLLALRIFAALLMIPYGVDKLARYDELAADFFGDPIGIGMEPSLVLTLAAQLGFTVLLIAGVQTRAMAALLAFHMAVATKFHFLDPFKVKVLPMLFLGIYIAVVALGAGRYSVDAVVCNRRRALAPAWHGREWMYVITVAAVFAAMWFVFGNFFGAAASAAILTVCALAVVWCYIDADDSRY